MQLRASVAGAGASQAGPTVGAEAPGQPQAETGSLVALFDALAGLGLFFCWHAWPTTLIATLK